MGGACMNEPRGFIAVVEDDVSLNQAIGRLLHAAGFHARLFETGWSLLEDADVRTMRCFVLDVHLPDMSAFELQRRLSAAGVTAPTVFITAHDDPRNQREARKLGASYLTKPFANRSLLDAVADAVRAATE
jgi:FixJ family two-component response regulator